ncbi:pyridoxamine 5'-phosphate oxidase family protein [Marinobacter sp. F4218]|nr:pyridoxamine 5'-phosphate oxidase family protein [Marinobacter sp. F4218]
MFFVATAAHEGRVNIAPKGMDSLRVLGPNRIVWLNLTGAENETAAHLLENPRMTLMWCSFDRKPLILRAYGKATSVHPRNSEWDELYRLFPDTPGLRQIHDLSVDLVLTSCGYGVPLYDFIGQRKTLIKWADRLGSEGMREYQEENNTLSLDGKPTGLLK